jgi:hypothetical protein
VCLACGKGMHQGEFKKTDDFIVHWGCSGLPRKR